MTAPVRTALQAWLRRGGSLAALLPPDETERQITTRGEVALLGKAIDAAVGDAEALDTLALLVRRVSNRSLLALVADEVLPRFRAWLDTAMTASPDHDAERERRWRVTAMAVVATLLHYGAIDDDITRLVRATHEARFADAPWLMGLDPLVRYRARDGVGPHEHLAEIMAAFRTEPPTHLAGLALAKLANDLMAEGRLAHHPFDTAAGRTRLHDLLADTREPWIAANSIAYVSERAELLAAADRHSDWRTVLWSHWARTKGGDPAGIDLLVRDCLDVRISTLACFFLRDLGLAERIPSIAMEPEFRARAQLAFRLIKHDGNGRPPDLLARLDIRELAWPPTNDVRVVALYSYTYHEPPKRSVALAGTTTTGLGDLGTPEDSPEDLYALYCCWELQQLGDARAPQRIDIPTGRALLGFTA